MSYYDEARSDAADLCEHFQDEIVAYLLDNQKAPKYLDDIPGADDYLRENHDFTGGLVEAAQLIDDLNDYEETDEGLWEGLAPRQAIEAMAHWTYQAAVRQLATELVRDEIGGHYDVDQLMEVYQELDGFDPDAEVEEEDRVSEPDFIKGVFEAPGVEIEYQGEATIADAQKVVDEALTERVREIINDYRR